MTGTAQARVLSDCGRLHLHHGPIDIVAEAFGAPAEIGRAYDQAAARFADILGELVAELDVLRAPVGATAPRVRGPVARRMVRAAWPHRGIYITPMAAVAGAVADEVLTAMTAGRDLTRAYVNNGGDIAFHIAPGQQLTAGVVANADAPALDADVVLDHAMPVRGLATSGWRGRSLSLGIADAVTVLARDAATADAAATLIANAVDVDHPAVARAPADSLRDDTDLGGRLVTIAVGSLPPRAVTTALQAGARAARIMRNHGLIAGAYLSLQGNVATLGGLAARVAA
mgnify:CR=1 FL=1|jgi:ApbE superfamily uncharacterized protein (UPF0280 family)